MGKFLIFTEKSTLKDQLNREEINLSPIVIDKLLFSTAFRDKTEAFMLNFSDATQKKIMTAYDNSCFSGLNY